MSADQPGANVVQRLPAPLLRVRGVTKRFGATQALGGVDLEVAAGEVHALIGENGAGKSTLMKILSGAQPADAGHLELAGRPYAPRDPHAARAHGVAMVYQELSLCRHLSVEENVLLGLEPTRLGVVRRAERRRRVQAVLDQVAGATAGALRPQTRVADLSPAEQQLVEIARGLALPACRVLILDEPTSSLTQADVRRLFDLLRRLRDQGLAIIYISHFLEEVQQLADRFTVLRDGVSVGHGVIADTPVGEIVRLMAGRTIAELFPRSARRPGEVVVNLEGVGGAVKPQSASLELRRGEILGLAGLIGAGRTELLRTVFGLDPVRRGTIRVGLVSGPASPAQRLRQGLGLLSEDRKGEGLALGLSIADNLTLSSLGGAGWAGRLGLVRPGRLARQAAEWVRRLSIRCRDVTQSAGELSGGNQQKMALGRLLEHGCDILLLDEPTRGIDVSSKAQIYALLDQLATRGTAVLMVSSYLPELLGVCDRVAVMARGRLGPTRPVGELTEHGVLLEATSGAAE